MYDILMVVDVSNKHLLHPTGTSPTRMSYIGCDAIVPNQEETRHVLVETILNQKTTFKPR